MAAAEWSCTVHREIYLTSCTTQHYRCPGLTDKNCDGICDNMILGAVSKSSGSPSSYSTPTSAGKYKTGVPSGLIGLAAVFVTVGAYLTFHG